MSHRRRFKQTVTLRDRLLAYANLTRDKAAALRPAPEQDALLKKARQADVAANIDAWATSPGLQPPK
jgi:hypothetical protein